MLKSLEDSASLRKFSVPSGLVTSIGPVNIPEHLDRPQIVTRDNEDMISISQFQRWGEPLDSAIMYTINEDVSLMVPQGTFELFPCNFAIPLDYQVIVNVISLEANFKKGLYMTAQWAIIDAKAKKMLFTKRSDLTGQITPHNYTGLTDALSKCIASLSEDIAQNLSILANQPKAAPDKADDKS
jgi:uncharacterized lipoprotein YmbA